MHRKWQWQSVIRVFLILARLAAKPVGHGLPGLSRNRTRGHFRPRRYGWRIV